MDGEKSPSSIKLEEIVESINHHMQSSSGIFELLWEEMKENLLVLECSTPTQLGTSSFRFASSDTNIDIIDWLATLSISNFTLTRSKHGRYYDLVFLERDDAVYFKLRWVGER